MQHTYVRTWISALYIISLKWVPHVLYALWYGIREICIDSCWWLLLYTTSWGGTSAFRSKQRGQWCAYANPSSVVRRESATADATSTYVCSLSPHYIPTYVLGPSAQQLVLHPQCHHYCTVVAIPLLHISLHYADIPKYVRAYFPYHRNIFSDKGPQLSLEELQAPNPAHFKITLHQIFSTLKYWYHCKWVFPIGPFMPQTQKAIDINSKQQLTNQITAHPMAASTPGGSFAIGMRTFCCWLSRPVPIPDSSKLDSEWLSTYNRSSSNLLS